MQFAVTLVQHTTTSLVCTSDPREPREHNSSTQFSWIDSVYSSETPCFLENNAAQHYWQVQVPAGQAQFTQDARRHPHANWNIFPLLLLASSVNTSIDNNRSYLLALCVHVLCELGLSLPAILRNQTDISV